MTLLIVLALAFGGLTGFSSADIDYVDDLARGGLAGHAAFFARTGRAPGLQSNIIGLAQIYARAQYSHGTKSPNFQTGLRTLPSLGLNC